MTWVATKPEEFQLPGVRRSTPGLAVLLLRRRTEAEHGNRGDFTRCGDELTFEIGYSRLAGRQLCDQPLLFRCKTSCLSPPTIEAIYKPPVLTIVLVPGSHIHQHKRS